MISPLVAILFFLMGWYSWYFQRRARVWKDPGQFGPEGRAARPPKVSVLIAFRNEAPNLQKLLNSLLLQTLGMDEAKRSFKYVESLTNEYQMK